MLFKMVVIRLVVTKCFSEYDTNTTSAALLTAVMNSVNPLKEGIMSAREGGIFTFFKDLTTRQ